MDVTVLGCSRRADVPTPSVPAVPWDCSRCGEGCWVSVGACLSAVLYNGVAVVCLLCLLPDLGIITFGVLPGQIEEGANARRHRN